jgi:DNA repair protein RadC
LKGPTPDARPREKLLALGPGALADVELIALLLGTGCGHGAAVRPADARRLRRLDRLLHACRRSRPHPGLGPAKRAEVAAMELARVARLPKN